VETADLAAAIYRGTAPADQHHGYLTGKALAAIGVRQHGRDIIVPMIDERLTLWNLQRIASDGGKRFLPNGRTAGLFWQHRAIKPDRNATDCPLVLAEGWATAAAIHEATGFGVVAAMSAANLLAVAKALRTLFPVRCIVIAADWDGHLAENMGQKSATKAAESIGARLAVPLPSGPEGVATGLGIDFADISHVDTAAIISAAITGEPI
jgi:putative DNA primase/helicase